MNIKTRIKKLEQGVQPVENKFCRCFDEHVGAVINQTYGEPYTVADVLPNPSLTGICNRCNRLVNGKTKELCSEIELIYGDAS